MHKASSGQTKFSSNFQILIDGSIIRKKTQCCWYGRCLLRWGFSSCFLLLEQAKAHSRELRKTDRELVRDRHKLEAEEQRLVRARASVLTSEG